MTDDEFAKLAEPLLKRLREPIERALRDARIRAHELNQIVLAGGARKPADQETGGQDVPAACRQCT